MARVNECSEDGRPGFRGVKGPCYTWDPKSPNKKRAQAIARGKAEAQGAPQGGAGGQGVAGYATTTGGSGT
jgi:hypothetical protein